MILCIDPNKTPKIWMALGVFFPLNEHKPETCDNQFVIGRRRP